MVRVVAVFEPEEECEAEKDGKYVNQIENLVVVEVSRVLLLFR